LESFAQSRNVEALPLQKKEKPSTAQKKCLTSLLLGNRTRVNGHVQRALVGRDLSRHRSGGNGNEDGGGSHFESCFG
jgi:hypothetical protein